MRPAGPSISIPTKLLATGVACAFAIIVCGTAATVVVAADVTNRLTGPERARMLAQAFRPTPDSGSSFRDTGATARALDSLVAPLGPTPPLDSAVASRLAALNPEERPGNTVWEAAATNDLPAAVPDPFHRRLTIPFERDGLSTSELAAAREDTRDPWLPLFRKWARAERRPALWGYRAGLPMDSGARDLPSRSLGAWRVLFAENEYASLFALRDGNHAEAMERARENVAASRHFLEQPTVGDALAGRALLQRSLQLLAYVSAESRDSATATRATHLERQLTTSGFAGAFNLKTLIESESKPGSRAAEMFVADTSQHPALRIEALTTIAFGGCRNLPELVFGFSGKRREAVSRAIANMHDIERSAELGARQLRYLDYMMALQNSPEVPAPKSILARSAMLNAFSWIVPPAVRARASLCAEQGL